MASANDWIKAAEEQAKKYSDSIKAQNQYLIDQQNAAKNNALDILKNQNQQAIKELNNNKETINSVALDNAKQANINRLLSLRTNEQAMNRAGLGTQGLVGTQVNSINNNYNTNLNDILNQKAESLKDVDKQIGDTNLEYNTNRENLISEYDSNIANLRKSINDSALAQYNLVFSNYLNQLQQEYEREQAEKQFAYKQQQDAIANSSNAKSGSYFSNNDNYTFSNANSNFYKLREELNKINNVKKSNTGFKIADSAANRVQQVIIKKQITDKINEAYINKLISADEVKSLLDEFDIS